MITLLHGDNIEASRNELNKIIARSQGKDVRRIDGRTLDTTALTQALESHSLFGGDTLVIIENLFGKLGRKTKLIEALTGIIVRSADTADIVVWEEKEIGATVVKNLGSKAKAILFKTPVILFQFLDGLRPANARALITLSQQLFQTVPAEVVFVMVTRRLRQLMMLRDNVTPEGLQGWQIGRLTSQAKSFTMKKLVTMYKKLLDMEVAIKTGNSPFTLSQHIEQFLIDL